MDNKTIFIKTKKGEDETQGKTTHLPGDIKRALLMVDGQATFGEINKRAAPSLRSSLDELFRDLEKGGFIRDKSRAEIRSGNIPKMSVPLKVAAPRKNQPENRAGELDFMGGFPLDPSDVPANTQKLNAEAEENIKGEIEAAKYSAQLEAEAILLKAEQEAARIREEITSAKLKAEREARQRLELAEQARRQAERLKEEQEALQVRIKLDAAREKAEQEAKLRLEATANAQARIESDDEDARRREEVEHRLKQELEARKRAEVERRLRQEQEAKEQAARELKAQEELKAARIREEAERIVRQEQEARERAARELKAQQELEAAKIREEVERRMRQEREEREARAREQATRTPDESSPESGSFSFGSFHVDNPLYTSESHMEKQSLKKDEPPAKNSRSGTADEKSGTFTFDAFQVDEPPLPVEPGRNRKPDSTAQASRPAGANRPADEQQAVPAAHTKPLAGKSAQQQIQHAVQERNATEQRLAAEQQAEKKLAEEQSRAWAEAERRALESAKADVEQASRQIAFTVADAPAARPSPVVRTRRKKFNWGRLAGLVFKTGLFLLLLLIGALFAIPYFISTREYLPKAEQLLSTKLHQPVHVGSLSGRILPTPRLELGEIYIGNAKQLQVNVAQVNFSFSGLFTDVKPVSSIEFRDIKVRGAWLTDASGWMLKMAGDERFPVSRMVIANGTLDADALELTGIEGMLDFDPDGKFTRADLRANSGKYYLGINATPASKLNIALTVRDSALPLLPNWTFDTLTAKGELGNGELVIGNFDGQLFGGSMQGSADLSWRFGWNAQGTLGAKNINMQKLNKLLNGNADGSARFKMSSADLGKLADSATLEGNFSSSDGIISGLEIADTARKLSRENLPGGRTHYDGLAGNFSFENGVYRFKQTKITASALSAIAAFEIDTIRQQLSGKMGVTLSLSGQTVSPVELKMGGTIDSPTLIYAP
ncbi:MAG: Adenylyl cyclase class-3/4/guanylyl cyclase [Candidatus Gallionella acididurans]|uniref:Adenylyl cyclase class-3/4/guanylyl cyclase n=1 Tax=Candidatus Gallionella acididurans TaxID=1796491 RepID=A0A139BU79_9PROT|nr:MAG: Adenylyl cyclase class-3/4/guanylyl cyclase [Candidatus Gallionella acididurans]